jgi:hypothetical protein
MAISKIGQVHGNMIELESALPELEGKRVRVVVEVVDETIQLRLSDEDRQWWQEWVDHGPQGPIEDDLDAEVP